MCAHHVTDFHSVAYFRANNNDTVNIAAIEDWYLKIMPLK